MNTVAKTVGMAAERIINLVMNAIKERKESKIRHIATIEKLMGSSKELLKISLREAVEETNEEVRTELVNAEIRTYINEHRTLNGEIKDIDRKMDRKERREIERQLKRLAEEDDYELRKVTAGWILGLI